MKINGRFCFSVILFVGTISISLSLAYLGFDLSFFWRKFNCYEHNKIGLSAFSNNAISFTAPLAAVSSALLALWDADEFGKRPPIRVFRTSITTPFTMACYENDHVCDDIFTHGYRAEWTTGLGDYIEDLRPGIDTFIDLGANTGFFGIAAAVRGVRVIAVEPANAHVCRLNAMLINGLSSDLYELHEVALVSTRGLGSMVQIVPWSNLGGSTLVKKETTTSWTALFNESEPHRDVNVTTATIDDVVRGSVLSLRRAVKLVKTDLEGFDIFAWQGGTELLASGLVFRIVAEWYQPYFISAGVKPQEYFDLFFSHGYWAFSSTTGGERILPQDVNSFCDKSAKSWPFDIRFELKNKPWPPTDAKYYY